MRNVLRLSLALATMALAAQASVGGEPQRLTIKPTLTKGDTFTLQIHKTREDARTAALGGAGADYLIDVAVLETGPDGSELQFTYRQGRYVGPQSDRVNADPTMKALRDMWNGVPIRVKLSPACKIAGLANYDEVRKNIVEGMEKMMTALAFNEQKKAQLRAGVARMVSSEAIALQVIARELTIYLGFVGTFQEGDGVEADITLPSPYGGEALPAHCRERVASIDKEAGTAEIVRETTVDAEALAANVKRMIDEMDRRAGREPDPTRTIGSASLKDVSRGTIDLKTHWPQRAHWERTAVAAGQRRVDIVDLTKLPAGSGFTDEPKGQPTDDASKDKPAAAETPKPVGESPATEKAPQSATP